MRVLVSVSMCLANLYKHLPQLANAVFRPEYVEGKAIGMRTESIAGAANVVCLEWGFELVGLLIKNAQEIYVVREYDDLSLQRLFDEALRDFPAAAMVE